MLSFLIGWRYTQMYIHSAQQQQKLTLTHTRRGHAPTTIAGMYIPNALVQYYYYYLCIERTASRTHHIM